MLELCLEAASPPEFSRVVSRRLHGLACPATADLNHVRFFGIVFIWPLMTRTRKRPSAASQTADPDLSGREAMRGIILERAGRIVAEESLAAVQARRLAVEGGCSVGTLYNIFGDRDGLILAINRETLTALREPLEAARKSSAKSGLEARLLALAFAYTTFALENRNRWLAVFEFRLPEDKPLPADFEAERARLFDLLVETIGRDVPVDAQRTTAARALFGAAHGILHLAVNNRLSDFDRQQLDRDLSFIVKAAAAGMRKI
jgi:AcrR family transcriptional regulator